MAEDAQRYYDDFSATYDRSRGSSYHRMLDDMAVDVALPYARGGSVLELGCGTGRILSRLAPVTRDAVGVDFSEGMLQRARGRGLDARLAHLHALPFGDDVFDLVYGFKVLPHVPDLEGAIAEAVRVTRPRGHLLLELYNPWSLRYLAKKLAGPQSTGPAHTEADVFTRWINPQTLSSLVPPGAELLGYHGVRILTPFAAAHDVPMFGRWLRRAERRASGSPLRRFGGFLIAVLRKA